MSVVYVLCLREVKGFLGSWWRVVGALAQPLLYIFVLGFGLRPIFHRAGEGDYVQFVAPGVIGMTILFVAFLSGATLLYDRQFGFLKETLVAPVPRTLIMLGRTLGSATTAMIQGTLVLGACMLAGFRPHAVAALPRGVLFMALTAIVFAALGTAVGSAMRSNHSFQLFTSLFLMPIFLLSGAIYPLANLPMPLAVATRLDPLTYGIDGLRGALIGVSQLGTAQSIVALVGMAAILLPSAAGCFFRIPI
jgi:ABC-2 type transport system permease protein